MLQSHVWAIDMVFCMLGTCFSDSNRAQTLYTSALGCLWDPRTLTSIVQPPQPAVGRVKHRMLPPIPDWPASVWVSRP
ncbi:hypothetical protein T484DRAFT_2952818 [Baffinella frigidus]|nr:hypothetical protein T484DRAFT_2952818 [Cryptophyta sp. CCMP2293]